MNTTEASQIYSVRVKDISMLCREKMIPGAKKEKRKWIIPDDLGLILKKDECIFVLKEILKSKNFGDSYPINRKLFPDEKKLFLVIDYLYKLGLIGEYNREEIKIQKLQLTDSGFDMVFGKVSEKQTASLSFALVSNAQAGLLNINVKK